jgi:transposase InsO family protein
VRASSLGIACIRTPPRAPKANSIAERLVETIRTECLDHIMVLNEGHLRRVLAEFMHYYNHDRPHRTLSLQSPVPQTSPGHGLVVSTPVLGGLHHAYARAA